MKRIILSSLIIASLALPLGVSADTGCASSYGSSEYGTTCPSVSINVNKTVKNPVTGEYVDNLGSNAPHFLPGQTVSFRIKVQNTGNTDLSNVAVSDRFPDFTDFVSGPGKFDNSSKTLSFSVDDLKAGEFREYDVVGKVNSTDQMSGGINCVSNFAQASANNQNSSDTATFCIETKVLAPVQELPKTGPVGTAATIVGSISLLAISLLLFKKTRVI